MAGLNYTLSCEVSGVNDNASTVIYEWKKDNITLSEMCPLLSFSPLRLSDAGMYTCTVSMYGCPFKRSKDLSTIEGSYIANESHFSHTVNPEIFVQQNFRRENFRVKIFS